VKNFLESLIENNRQYVEHGKLETPEPPEDISAYAASLDVNQRSDTGLGTLFAEKVILTCHP
jgi:ABC-type uncharacterized transport system substrate-binding protein